METGCVVMWKLKERSLTSSEGPKEGFSEWMAVGWGPEEQDFWWRDNVWWEGGWAQEYPVGRCHLQKQTHILAQKLSISGSGKRGSPKPLRFLFAMQLCHGAHSPAPSLALHPFLKGDSWNLPLQRGLCQVNWSAQDHKGKWWSWSVKPIVPLTLMPGHFTIKFKYLNFRLHASLKIFFLRRQRSKCSRKEPRGVHETKSPFKAQV